METPYKFYCTINTALQKFISQNCAFKKPTPFCAFKTYTLRKEKRVLGFKKRLQSYWVCVCDTRDRFGHNVPLYVGFGRIM